MFEVSIGVLISFILMSVTIDAILTIHRSTRGLGDNYRISIVQASLKQIKIQKLFVELFVSLSHVRVE